MVSIFLRVWQSSPCFFCSRGGLEALKGVRSGPTLLFPACVRCTCMCTHTHALIHTHTHAHTHSRAHMHAHACTHTLARACTHTRTFAHTRHLHSLSSLTRQHSPALMSRGHSPCTAHTHTPFCSAFPAWLHVAAVSPSDKYWCSAFHLGERFFRSEGLGEHLPTCTLHSILKAMHVSLEAPDMCFLAWLLPCREAACFQRALGERVPRVTPWYQVEARKRKRGRDGEQRLSAARC